MGKSATQNAGGQVSRGCDLNLSAELLQELEALPESNKNRMRDIPPEAVEFVRQALAMNKQRCSIVDAISRIFGLSTYMYERIVRELKRQA